MAKVTINGEVFQWDGNKTPLSEAIMVERDLGCRYAEYEQDRLAGSARAIAEFIRLVWLRNGRDVPLDDLLNGTVEVDLLAIEVEDDEAEDDPKESPDPAGTHTTPTGTRRTSQKSST